MNSLKLSHLWVASTKCFALLYKRYARVRLEKWITGVGTTKTSLAAEKAVHGLHYNTSVRVYRKIFDAIVQIQMEDFTNMYVNIDRELINNFINLRKEVNVQKRRTKSL